MRPALPNDDDMMMINRFPDIHDHFDASERLAPPPVVRKGLRTFPGGQVLISQRHASPEALWLGFLQIGVHLGDRLLRLR